MLEEIEVISEEIGSEEREIIGEIFKNINSIQIDKRICNNQLPANFFLKIPLTLLGISAGMPWYNSAIDSGELIGEYNYNNIFGYIIAGSMLIAYGATTIRAGYELVDSAHKPLHESFKVFIEHKHTNKHVLEHSIYHLLGFLTTIPSAYLSIVFNSNTFVYVPLVVLVTYIFNTFALYGLGDTFIKPLLSYFMDKKNKIAETSVTGVRTDLVAAIKDIITSLQADGIYPPLENDFILLNDDEIRSNLAKLMLQAKKRNNSCGINKVVFYSLILTPTFILPILNGFFYYTITYKPLYLLYPNSILCNMFTPLIVFPLCSLDMYSIYYVLKDGAVNIKDIFINNQKISVLQKYFGKTFFLTVTLTALISAVSTLNNFYIAETEMDQSEFKDFSLFFALSVYSASLCLETWSFFKLSESLVNYSLSKFNPLFKKTLTTRKNLLLTEEVVLTIKEECIKKFQDKEPLIEENQKEEDFAYKNDLASKIIGYRNFFKPRSTICKPIKEKCFSQPTKSYSFCNLI